MNVWLYIIIGWLTFDALVYLYMWYDHINFRYNFKNNFKEKVRQVILSFVTDDE